MKLTTSKYYIPSGRCVQAIDYQHRNADGSAGRVPDSLTNVFYTEAGREVRDGGGIRPDIEVAPQKAANILYYLVNENMIFDYATQYCLKHPTIAPANEFRLTDQDFKDFKEMVKQSDFKYDQQTGKLLKNLREIAEFEGYLEGATAEFEALEKKLQHNLEHDLDHSEKDIRQLLSLEIIKRYYYQKGGIIEQLKDDPDLKAAINVLQSPEEYKRLLSKQEAS